MATMTIRNIPDETYRAIKVRAALNDRSAEAEVRVLIQEAVQPRSGGTLLEALQRFGREVGMTDDDLALFERDRSAPREVDFG